MTEWIGAAEAAERLGIKQASLYAYVSRGVLSRRRDADGRASIFDSDEVKELARKGRPRRSGGPAELVIETAVTEIRDSTLRYRGHDATDLALRRSFEDVAALLWTGELPADGGPERLAPGRAAGSDWQATAEALAVGRAAQAALPAGTLPLERLQVIVPALAATDPFRLQLDRPAVVAAGQALIAGMTGALPAPGGSSEGRAPDSRAADGRDADGRDADSGDPDGGSLDGRETAPAGPVAARLAAALCIRPAPLRLLRVLNAALVLVADHELAASTLAVRVAASMRADPYAVVATGLGAMGGALHGGAALGAELMLGSAKGPEEASRVVGDLLRRGERLPGFGHFVYTSGDPRANLLLQLIGEYAPGSAQLAIAMAVTDEARRRALPQPNIEFALAVLAQVAGMVRGAGEAIFATGRTAGWLAHSLEEYERNIPIRPRGVYTGQSAT
ncbi:MAG: citrate/2-methylcitrate synthase [Streptosporangiaceae bacterium]